MVRIEEKLAKQVDFTTKDDTIYGRVNDIFYNVKIIKSKKTAQPNNLSETLIYRKEKNPLAFIISPKYETAVFDVFATRSKPVDLVELNDFIETNYFIYKVYKMNYIEDHFSFLLDKNQSFNIKIPYIAQFMNDFSNHLKELDYYSACTKCGSTDNITCKPARGMVIEICTACALKETAL
ncbi:MAG: hypothetical protein HN948_09055 [Clostridia bacterium]|jgi:hypothetical protein|nr:hypothetical protein [Clostridia bacterium]MBT7123139.1 hypothetical protein [Clostridia bacterium]